MPDVFVEYRPDPQTDVVQKPSLVKVKSAEDLMRHAEKYGRRSLQPANMRMKEVGTSERLTSMRFVHRGWHDNLRNVAWPFLHDVRHETLH